MVRRELKIPFAIDANRINARQSLPNMNRLEKWKADGIISIHMPEAAHGEAWEGGDSQRRMKASFTIMTLNTAESGDQRELRRKTQDILSPGRMPDRNTSNDIDIIANAKKYHCILITADGGSRSQPGGILGHREELRALGVSVVTDAEAVAMVEEGLRRRDQAELISAQTNGREPAWWVGQDF
jgi:hypothetical protein